MNDIYAALRDFMEIAQKAKPNCGPKLRALIQAAQEKHRDVCEAAMQQPAPAQADAHVAEHEHWETLNSRPASEPRSYAEAVHKNIADALASGNAFGPSASEPKYSIDVYEGPTGATGDIGVARPASEPAMDFDGRPTDFARYDASEPAPASDEISPYEWMAREFERLAILRKMWNALEVAAILRRYDIERPSEPARAPCQCGELREAAERYLRAVASLGEQSGYNKLTFFEAPIGKMPNDELGMEAVRRWRELNDAGVALLAATALRSGESHE